MATRTTKRSAAALQAEYEAMMEGRDIDRALTFNHEVGFQKDDLLDHGSFGLGVVTRLLSDKKIEVMFRDGTKVLIHDRGDD